MGLKNLESKVVPKLGICLSQSQVAKENQSKSQSHCQSLVHAIIFYASISPFTYFDSVPSNLFLKKMNRRPYVQRTVLKASRIRTFVIENL